MPQLGSKISQIKSLVFALFFALILIFGFTHSRPVFASVDLMQDLKQFSGLEYHDFILENSFVDSFKLPSFPIGGDTAADRSIQQSLILRQTNQALKPLDSLAIAESTPGHLMATIDFLADTLYASTRPYGAGGVRLVQFQELNDGIGEAQDLKFLGAEIARKIIGLLGDDLYQRYRSIDTTARTESLARAQPIIAQAAQPSLEDIVKDCATLASTIQAAIGPVLPQSDDITSPLVGPAFESQVVFAMNLPALHPLAFTDVLADHLNNAIDRNMFLLATHTALLSDGVYRGYSVLNPNLSQANIWRFVAFIQPMESQLPLTAAIAQPSPSIKSVQIRSYIQPSSTGTHLILDPKTYIISVVRAYLAQNLRNFLPKQVAAPPESSAVTPAAPKSVDNSSILATLDQLQTKFTNLQTFVNQNVSRGFPSGGSSGSSGPTIIVQQVGSTNSSFIGTSLTMGTTTYNPGSITAPSNTIFTITPSGGSGTVAVGGNLSVAGTASISGVLHFNSLSNFSNIASAQYVYLNPGTAASPALAFAVDQDTGIYRPAANQLGFATLGLEHLRINAGGNIGIGTTNPLTVLDIKGGASVSYFRSTGVLNLGLTSSAATVSYNRFGTGTTGHSNYISVANDVLVSGDLEVKGSTSLNNALTINGGVGVASVSVGGTFRLGNISGATDPTGATGLMYYNTTNNKFRCYENGAWSNCVGASGNSSTFAHVSLASSAFDLDTTASHSIAINDTGGGKLVQLQHNGSNQFYIGNSGYVVASGSLNVGLTGNTATVSYNRFGTSTTNHSLSAVNDVLIGGKLEVAGNTYLDGTVNFGGKASASLVYAQQGTAASPSFAFAIDQDTGIFRPAINQLAFSTLGLERLRINANGNVGIGTTNPLTVLDIKGGASASYFRSNGVLNLGLTSSAATVSYNRFGTSTTGHSNYISASDDVLVSGDLEVRSSLAVAGPASISNSIFIPAAGGNVAIGTSDTSGEKFKVIGTRQDLESATSNASMLEFQVNTDSSCLNSTNCTVINSSHTGAGTNLGLAFQIGGTEKMRLDSNGNLAIGTTSGAAPLEVQTTGTGTTFASNNPSLRLRSQASGRATSIQMGDGTNTYMYLAYLGGSSPRLGLGGSSEVLSVGNDGNVGIGTTTTNGLLTMYSSGGRLWFQDATVGNTTTDGFFVEGTDAGGIEGNAQLWNYENGFIRFGTNNAERMRIDNTGNVGIGKTSPLTKLDVGGGASASYFRSNGVLNLGLTSSAATVSYNRFGTSTTNHSNYISAANDLLVSGDLEVRGSISANIASVSKLFVMNNAASASIFFQTNGSGGTNQSNFSIGVGNGGEALNIFNNVNSPIITIASTGNVGIGTSSPKALFAVHTATNFNLTARDITNSLEQVYVTAKNDADSSLAILSLEGSRLYLNQGGGDVIVNGYRGCGKLDVNVGSELGVTILSTNSQTEILGSNQGSCTANPLRIRASALYLQPTGGNIGIGTTAPLTVLDIKGGASASYFRSTGVLNLGLTSSAATVSYNRFGTSTTGHSNYISASDDVLVSGDLEVRSSLAVAGPASISNTLWVSPSGSGNVGIGTTAPTGRLFVVDTTSGVATDFSSGLRSAIATGNVASISGTGLTTGNLLRFTTPTSSSFTGNIILAKDNGGTTLFAVRASGAIAARSAIYSHGSTTNCTAAGSPVGGCIDYAEDMPVSSVASANLPDGKAGATAPEAGDIVTIDPTSDTFAVMKATTSYDRNMLGIVSTNPAITIGDSVRQGEFAKKSPTGSIPVALAGRVPVKVSDENGLIKKGDYLTSSAMISGAAMKATKKGRVIGIALEDQLPDHDTVMLLINPHYAGEELDANGQLADFSGSTVLQTKDGTLSVSTLFSALYSYLKDNLAITLENGLIKVAKLMTDAIETQDVKTNTIESQSGYTIFDTKTGDPYCIQVTNGQMVTNKGACGSGTSPNTPAQTPIISPTPTPTPSETPGESATPTPEHATPTPSITPEASIPIEPTSTATPTPTPSETPGESATPTPEHATPTPSITPQVSETIEPISTLTPTPVSTESAPATPTPVVTASETPAPTPSESITPVTSTAVESN